MPSPIRPRAALPAAQTVMIYEDIVGHGSVMRGLSTQLSVGALYPTGDGNMQLTAGGTAIAAAAATAASVLVAAGSATATAVGAAV